MTPEVTIIRETVRTILLHPEPYQWSTQGFGMMRAYLDTDKRFRLNVWDAELAVPGVSIIHDHPWDFQSWILGGMFKNIRFTEDAHSSKEYEWQIIKTGPGGGPEVGPYGKSGKMKLTYKTPELYYAGDTYRQEAEEIHASYYADGTVTINDRRRREDGEHARVFWPAGEKWIDAEPRDATPEEVARVTRRALQNYDRKFTP